MPRENAHDKGRRLLVEGRVRVTYVDNERIEATCVGDSADVYTLEFDQRGVFCSCAAVGRCSHAIALQLVTFRPTSREAS